LRISRQAAHRTAARLERAGLLRCVPRGGDRRLRLASLTPDGERSLERLESTMRTPSRGRRAGGRPRKPVNQVDEFSAGGVRPYRRITSRSWDNAWSARPTSGMFESAGRVLKPPLAPARHR